MFYSDKVSGTYRMDRTQHLASFNLTNLEFSDLDFGFSEQLKGEEKVGVIFM